MRFNGLRSVILRQRRPVVQIEPLPFQILPFKVRLLKPGRFRPWVIAVAAFAVLTVFPFTAGLSQQDEKPLPEKGALPPLNPLANPKPDANRFMEYEMQRKQMQKRVEELNVLRHKEMTEDTAQLVKLAAEVKIETNTARLDALSALELRKVETIEKLAHGVREKMKTTVN
jgi:hypothetical protein